MTMALSSSGIDKLTGAGVILSGAAADDMDIEVFVLVNAAQAFLKSSENMEDHMSESGLDVENFKEATNKLSTPSWQEFFEMAKELTNTKIFMCSLAGKIAGGEKMEDFIDLVDEICGIGEYIDSAQSADVHLFI